ncbi:hypothetical protein CW745_11095 [Psychromonas sp. psych-6C06]|nr:hypothetical protein CW745_11095 [Psychromonas sp. psych-6C06]
MKFNVSATMLCAITLTITGCSNTSQPSAEMQKITNQQTEIEMLKTQQQALQDELNALQAMQSDVERLVEREAELNKLIQESKDLAKENKMKAIQEKRRLRDARPFFMLQTASLNSLDDLKNAWQLQQEEYPEILNGLPARYQQVEMAGREYFRLKSGEFDHKGDAVMTCEMLMDLGADCIVVNNKGIKF